MSILNVENLSHGFGDRAIFNNVSFRLLKGEHIGLIGANGEGKSTFMNIITGKLQPDEGKIEWSKKVRVGYLDQHTVLQKGMTIRDVLTSAFDFLLEMEQELNAIYDKMGEADEETLNQLMEESGTLQDLLTMHDFYMIDSKVEEVGRALGLVDIGLDKDVSELSGGQRTKVLLGKLLLEKPDILLLDEPTNYLDKEHIEWLKRYLNEYENAFILISHDIPFLNSVVNLIYHMDNQELNRYVGDYDKFQEVYAMKKAQLEAAYNKQQKEIADLKDFVARNKARVATRNMAMSRQKKLDKMDVIELAAEKPKPEFNFKEARTPGRYIFQTKDLVIGYDEPLSSPLNLEMERNEKIVLTGANGIGKTTLLKSILGLIEPISGSVEQGDYLEIGYFEQEMDQSISTTCIEEIWKEFPSYSQYEVRSALAKCGLTTKHIESLVKVLSGGEQAKVRLCKLINKASNVLVLDEPTNHLDVDAKAELKRALQAYKGSIIMVCHEPEFYEGLATDVWDCTKWTTRTV
ncbi:MAG: ABC-F family ATP-binding cassette domain-containing protein [Lachnospiraceae bacterium]|nr:ABC-F family ATP-binding cassette domain-containing protein [Lachnospiraceae bacterium]